MKARGISILFRLLSMLVVLCVVIALSFFVYRAALQSNVLRRTDSSGSNGIDSLEQVELGGVRQWILLRGRDTSRPVLLILHGGPGAADIMLARHFDGELVDDFVVVHWDQRGAGKSYDRSIPPESMTRSRFVEDARELAQMLAARFRRQRIYLLGHSWGSEIGALAVARYPELFQAYIGVGQVVAKAEQEAISYRYVLDRASEEHNEEALRELRRLGPPPYDGVSGQSMQRKWLERLGGVYHGAPISMLDYVRIALASPDYTLLDGVRFFRGQEFSESAFWQERLSTDLFREVPRIEVPVYFFAGRYDYNTPSELVERYYRALDAPRGKTLIWFEHAGHMIPYESPSEFRAALRRVAGDARGKIPDVP